MPRLESVRRKQRKSTAAVIHAGRHTIECLERRTLLNATLISAISAVSVTPSGPATTVNLSSHFHDPIVPGTLVEVTTPLGVIPIALTDSTTPHTVANFLQYINGGQYQGTIFHRLAAGFALQGGGFTTSGSAIPTLGTINGEPGQSNVTGSIAMALSSGPNSGTSQWFVNLANNDGSGTTPNLNDTSDGGPFTVFGHVVYNGMTIVNSITALKTVDDSAQNGAWNTLPVLGTYTGSSTPTSVAASDMVTTNYSVVQPLTYTVSSDNSSVVTASVSGSTLTLTPGATAGQTQVHVTATDIAGNTATTTFNVGEGAQTVTESVTVGTKTVQLVRFIDSKGTVGNIAVTGRGNATITLTGAGLKESKAKNGIQTVFGKASTITVVANGTIPSTIMTIWGTGGDHVLHLDGITVNGALSLLNARTVALAGALTATGSIQTINLGNVSNNTLTIGPGPASTIRLGSVTNENLGTYNTVKSLTADSWTGTSQFNVPFIRSMKIGGAFSANFFVGGMKDFVAGSITGGIWAVPGKVTNINVQTMTNWTATIGSGGSVNVAGTVNSSTLNTMGDLGSFISTGMTNSNVYTGANGLSSGLPSAIGQFTSSQKITSFTVNGRFVNSNVAAETITKANLGSVQTSNGGKAFGIASHNIHDLRFNAGKNVHLTKLTTQAQVNAALKKQNVAVGNFAIDIL